MASYTVRNERQREMVKLFNKLCHRYSRYEVWQDMAVMIACAIANAVDRRHFDKREKMYMRVVEKYEQDEVNVFPEFFAHIVMGMDEHPDGDCLGELYMNHDLGNSNVGQYFTPYDVSRMMAQMTLNDDFLKGQIEKRGWITVNDCACGAGVMLVAAANYLRSIGVNYQMQALFVAQDIDTTAALMCYIQLSLMGCAGYVKIGNTLTEPMIGDVLFGEGTEAVWYTPMYFHTVWNMRRATVMTERMLQAVATPVPETGSECPTENMPEARTTGNVIGGPESEPATETIDARRPVLTISTGKKNAGQVMFDFG